MSSKLDEANQLCEETLGKPYFEIFDDADSSDAEIEANMVLLRKKTEFVSRTKLPPEPADSYLDLWRKYWNSIVIRQPLTCEMYAMCAGSQLLKHVTVVKQGGVEEDIRVNPCIIMPSGTGKSEGNDILATFARQIGLVFTSVDRYNDAVLVGSVIKAAIDYNLKNRKNPGDPGYMDPDEKGILRKSHFVVFDEGENILKTSKETEGAQRYLQKAMNRHNSEGNYVSNNLVGYQIGGYPDCSIVITSYYLEEFQETLLDRGLLQRMVVLIQEENYDTRTAIIDSTIDGIPTYEDIKTTKANIRGLKNARLDLIQKLVDEARQVRDYHIDTESMSLTREAKEIMKSGVNELRELMPFMTGQKQIWESMVTRMAINLLKISAIHAMVNYRKYVDVPDVLYATNIMIQTMTSVGFFLREHVATVSDRKTIQIHTLLKRKYVGESFPSMKWVALIMEEFHFQENKAKYIIKNLVENGKFKEIKKDGKNCLLIQ